MSPGNESLDWEVVGRVGRVGGGGVCHCYWVEGEPSKILWHTQTRTRPGQAMADNCQWHKLRLNMYRGNNEAPQVLTTTRARLAEL